MMSFDDQQLRLEGIYRQNDRGEYMQRVKLPGGILSVEQAALLAELGNTYGSGTLHISTRGSIEFHGLSQENLPEVHRRLSSVGLFSRGACGGAVRGISCSSSFGPGFGRTQILLRHFLSYFSGNPHYEGLPKKFKIAFEAGYERSRHLIQDLAFVLVEEANQTARYDVWIAGGLGREPQAGFLFADRVEEEELLPLAESVIKVYKDWGDKGRRLKHLLNEIGEEELRSRIAKVRETLAPVSFNDAFPKSLLPDANSERTALNVFAGELPAGQLAELVKIARKFSVGWILATPDQDLEIIHSSSAEEIRSQLVSAGFVLRKNDPALRVCPGNHDCRMGLCATRDLAKLLLDELGASLEKRSLAISGCSNSCAQPQLAEFGIIASRIRREGDDKTPLFDLYQRQGTGLGVKVLQQVELNALVEELRNLLQKA